MVRSSAGIAIWVWRLGALLSGILAGAGTLIASAWMFTPLGLGFFFYLLWKKAASTKEAAWFGLAFGIATAGAGLLSLLEAAPANATLSTTLAVGMLWLVPTLALGAVTAPIAILIYMARGNAFAPLIAVLAWIVNDELRMWAWMLITYGPGASIDPHLSITALGYALADSPYLLQLAESGGLLFLTCAVALFAAALACLPDLWYGTRLERVRGGAVILCALIVASLPSFIHSPAPAGHRVLHIAVFSTNVRTAVPASENTLTAKILSAPPPEVVLLPEGKTLDDVFGESAVLQSLKDAWFRGANDTLTIRSSETLGTDGARHNTVFFDSRMLGTLAQEDKQFIMPEGEYLPFLSRIFLAWFPGATLTNVASDTTIVHGSALATVPFDGVTFGALLCSEVFSSRLYRALVVEKGAQVLVNLADPEWFRGSRMLYRKTVQIAKVHAVQNRAYFLAADNAEPSFIIDPEGHIVAETAWGATDVLLFDLPVAPH